MQFRSRCAAVLAAVLALGATGPSASALDPPPTLECPSPAALEELLGREFTRVAGNRLECNYEDGRGGLRYKLSSRFGAVSQFRSHIDSVFMGTTVVTEDFLGLGPGAFLWGEDASPTTLAWQLGEGVVASVNGWDERHALRAAARLLDQPHAGPAAQPGLPASGR